MFSTHAIGVPENLARFLVCAIIRLMNELKKSVITTPLGEMIALATEDNLVLLEFTDNENTEKDIDFDILNFNINYLMKIKSISLS